MTSVLNTTLEWYDRIFLEWSDQRTLHWPFMRSPIPVLALVAAYVWFATKGGPKFMKNRKPYEIKKIIQYYNILQIVCCGGFGIPAFFVFYGPWGDYSWFCEPLDYGYSTKAMRHLILMYGYFLLKVLDLLDTVFFIMRKKYSQLTFLHVYHHALMVLITWFALRFIPGGHVAFSGLLNTIIHSLVYTYYYLASKNKQYRDSLWWKKYLTIIQIVQFGLIFVHNMQMLLNPNCNFPKFMVAVQTPQSLVFTYLFAKFYKSAYIDKKEPKEKAK